MTISLFIYLYNFHTRNKIFRKKVKLDAKNEKKIAENQCKPLKEGYLQPPC